MKKLLLLLLPAIAFGGVGYTGNGFIPTANTELSSCAVQTTDQVLTQCGSVTLPTNSGYLAKLDCTGIRDDNTEFASVSLMALVKRAAGAASMEGSVVTLFDQAGSTTWDADITASGNDAIFSVKGSVAKTVNWTCKIEMVKKL